jgi:hypothetical protein
LLTDKYVMTRKLEELFDLPPSDATSKISEPNSMPAAQLALQEIDATIDKIDQALPAVRGLDASDTEMDDLAAKAQETFDNLMDLGFNVDSRYASEIFAVAGTMLGHAITAKTAKLNKKLKMVDLQMKKLKMDQDGQGDQPTATAHGQVLSRNDLLEMIKGTREQKDK